MTPSKQVQSDQLPIVDTSLQRAGPQNMRVGVESRKPLFLMGIISMILCFFVLGSDDQIKVSANYQNLLQMAQGYTNITSILAPPEGKAHDINVIEILYKQNKYFLIAKQLIFLSFSLIYLSYFMYYCYDRYLYRLF